MVSRVTSRLSEARHRRFVGRTAELSLFESALVTPELPFQVLHIFGPGGVGKTSLLNEFAYICEQAQVTHIHVDCRNIEPSPSAFIEAAGLEMGPAPSDSPLQGFTSPTSKVVLLVDTYESVAPLDDWLREVFLPQTPDNMLTVVAGRNPPSIAWRTDPGWQTLIKTIPIRNLSPQESKAYLTSRDVPTRQRQAVLDFTHGHPLALSLVADLFGQGKDFQFEPDAAPDMVKALLERFVQNVPSPAHRAALEACALVRLITESLLSEMLSASDSHELFEWLREQSFIESGPMGLFPHDLTREALAADLHWRNPDWYSELHRRARVYYNARLDQTRDQEQQRILMDYIFLHRDNPVVRPFFDWQESGGLLADTMQESDKPILLEMVLRHEGKEAVSIAKHWLSRQPQGVTVFRDSQQPAAGFLLTVPLHEVTEVDLKIDPAAQASWRYLQKHAPLRGGEGASLFRFWMARDTYQGVSPVQSLIFVSMVRHYRTTAGLAFTFLPCAYPDFWAPMFAYADLDRIPESDFEIGSKRYGVYGHDWRKRPPTEWLELLAEREVATALQPMPTPKASTPTVVLSQNEFEIAVRAALRDYSRPTALRSNPLTNSRMVIEKTGTSSTLSARVDALRSIIQATTDSLQGSPKEGKFYRALYHTYISPAPTQEQAAELLDIPFSTYRRHLKSGINRVGDALWRQEIGDL